MSTWRVAAKGRIGGWMREGVDGAVCHSAGASPGEWGCDLASRCVRSAAEFQCGRSCLCPRVSLASVLRPLRGRVSNASAGRPPWGAALWEFFFRSSCGSVKIRQGCTIIQKADFGV